MSGPPFRPGFVQRAVRLVAEPETAASVGFAGLSGCSSSSVRLIVTSMVALAVASDAFIVTA